METQQAARWEAAIGKNANRYLTAFERIRARGPWMPGWNGAAFLHSSAWFCYRRMYGLAALNFFAPLVLVMALAALGSGPGLTLSALVGYLGVVFILVPAFADSLYYRHLQRRLEAARPPSRWTGLAAAAVVSASAVLVFTMMNAGYQADSTRRAKLSEGILSGMSARTQVDEFFRQHGRVPTQAEAVKFDLASKSRYVESIAYEATHNAVVLKLAEPFAGKHLELRAAVKGQDLVWRCGSPDLPKRDLPGSCRD